MIMPRILWSNRSTSPDTQQLTGKWCHPPIDSSCNSTQCHIKGILPPYVSKGLLKVNVVAHAKGWGETAISSTLTSSKSQFVAQAKGWGETAISFTLTSSKSQFVHSHFVHSQFGQSHFIQCPLHPVPTLSSVTSSNAHSIQWPVHSIASLSTPTYPI